jgi:hypothetical protein
MKMRATPLELLSVTMLLIMALLFAGAKCFGQEEDKTALWLARSCIGEAGYNAHETGECAAIWHVYKKRGAINGKGTLWTARKYSAAIKNGAHQRNKWVMHLSGAEQPRKWPRNLNWSKYRDRWLDTLERAKAFVRGELADPLPSAVHYGSRIDRHRARKNWRRVKSPFKNWFWRVL